MKRITVTYDAETATVASVLDALRLTDIAVTALSITIADSDAPPPRGKPGRKPGPQKRGNNVHALTGFDSKHDG